MGFCTPRTVALLVTVSVSIVAWYSKVYVFVVPNLQNSPLVADRSVAGDNKTSDGLPTLAWIDPIKVGHVRQIKMSNGDMKQMRSLSIRPALFEIEHFLSPDECEDIIFMAKTQGLENSRTLIDGVLKMNESTLFDMVNDPDASFEKADANNDGVIDKAELTLGISFVGDILLTGKDLDDLISDLELDPDKDGNLSRQEYRTLIAEGKMEKIINYTAAIKKDAPRMRTRLSNTAFLDPLQHVGHKKLFDDIRQRIQDLTGLKKDIIWTSENLQVLRYDKNGHYHCHYDSEDESKHPEIPCCHYFNHVDDEDCLPCRYVTVFYYLNEPEEGGETAFPIADNETTAAERMRREEQHLCDLSRHCHDAKIRYKPKKGTALFWYNHHRDDETGWLGDVDTMSYHGGCDVKKGTKWAANSWINVGKNREQDLEAWEAYKELIENYDDELTGNAEDENDEGFKMSNDDKAGAGVRNSEQGELEEPTERLSKDSVGHVPDLKENIAA